MDLLAKKRPKNYAKDVAIKAGLKIKA